jgi:hypothetical protein
MIATTKSTTLPMENPLVNKAKTRNMVPKERVRNYRSNESEDGSSKLARRSINSRGSYKIEYLISKAFTPIVPSDHELNEISKISWNRGELLENISYSGITESILMGRNPTLQNSVFNKTDYSNCKRKSIVWQSKESSNPISNAFKSPQPRGNKVKKTLDFQRSFSNGKKTISSIAGADVGTFPPVGFGDKDADSISNNFNGSRIESGMHRRMKSIPNSSILSPKINLKRKDYSKGHIADTELIQKMPSEESSQRSGLRDNSEGKNSAIRPFNSNLDMSMASQGNQAFIVTRYS